MKKIIYLAVLAAPIAVQNLSASDDAGSSSILSFFNRAVNLFGAGGASRGDEDAKKMDLDLGDRGLAAGGAPAGAPEDSALEALATSNGIITPDMSKSQRSYLFKGLKRVDEGKETFIAQVAQLITPGMTVDDRGLVIYTWEMVPVDQRTGLFFNQVLQLITPDMKAKDRRDVISVLESVPKEERVTFIDQIEKVIPKCSAGFIHAIAIRELVKFPAGERDKWVEENQGFNQGRCG